jgi:membrane-associated phospholipid phosphatase
MPLAMGFAVVATANHFVLDVVAGMLVVAVGLALALLFERHRARSGGAARLPQNPNNPALRPRLH